MPRWFRTVAASLVACVAAALAAPAPTIAQTGQAPSQEDRTNGVQASPSQDTDGVRPRPTDVRTEPANQAQPQDPWAGSFPLDGVDTEIKIGGFLEFNAIHDSDAISTPGEFVTSAIATGNAAGAQGTDGRTRFSVQPSRLYIGTRTPIDGRRLTTVVSADLFGDSSGTSPDLRLRTGYAELSNAVLGGDLLVGKAWSTFAELAAFPNTLDFEGPNSFFGIRQTVLRWTRDMGEGLKLMLAAETPSNHSIEGAGSRAHWPDGVVALTWDHGPASLKAAVLARDLQTSIENGSSGSTVGWGGSLAGKMRMPTRLKQDFLTFSVTYGQGIGSAFNDAPPDAVFDGASGSLKALETFGWFASYQHAWHPKLYSVLVYGELQQDNEPAQSADAFHRTQYASANLVWTPVEHWLFGIELLYGKREDRNGADGSDLRTLFSTRFSF